MQVTHKDIVSIAESSGLSVDLSNIQGSGSLREAGIDSLDKMTFYLGIEEKFNIKIPDDEIEALDTINNIIAYIENI